MEKFANPDAAFYAIAGLQGITGIAAPTQDKKNMRIYLFLIGTIILMSGITGCNAVNNSTSQYKPLPFEQKTPGNPSTNDYRIDFLIDNSMIQQGATYTYSPEGEGWIHGLGGSRSGYGMFGELVMDFSFKDGRTFHEVIDLRTLMSAMLQRYIVYDLSQTEFGGSAGLIIRIDQTKLTIDYCIIGIKSKNPHFLWEYWHYPVFEKTFLGFVSKDIASTEDEQQWKNLPGNPDLNLYGISFVLDRDYFVSGTYRYSPEGDKVIHIPEGGRYGYQSAGELNLDFTIKDGRQMQQKVDLRLLLRELKKNPALVNLADSKFGGYADFVVRVTEHNLAVDYRLLERTEKTELTEMDWDETYKLKADRQDTNYRLIQDLRADPSQYKEYLYPLYRKKFDM